MITYKEDIWLHNTQIIRDRIYELEHLVMAATAYDFIATVEFLKKHFLSRPTES
jgi:hypothetical protein